jgi:hypothetical protein
MGWEDFKSRRLGMAEEQDQQKGEKQKGMMETIMTVPGAKVLGKQEDKKKAAEQIMRNYEDRPTSRDEKIMEDFEDSVHHDAKSIGERIEDN